MKYLVGASTDAPWYVTPAANADGVTDDTVQLQLALDTGLDVMLAQGKTYIVNGTLKLTKQGQAVYLNGATVKRAAQVSSTLAVGITGGVTSRITVADATFFKVGMAVSITAAGGISQLVVTAAGSGYSSAPAVAISGSGTGTCAVDAGGAQRVVSASVTGAGSGYLTSPTITLSGGGGTGAAIMAALSTVDETTSPPKITSIVGNTLILDDTLDTTMAAGSTVYTCGFMFDLEGGDNAILGPGTIDGNKANQTYFRWQSTACVRVFSDRCRVQHVHIINAAGEGIELYNSYATVEDCILENLNGNGVHQTNSPNAAGTPPGGHHTINNCRVFNCNLDLSVGHADGGIIWSDSVLDGTVTNCKVDTTPRMGIGSIDSTGNSDATLANNVLVNCLGGGIGINPGNAASAPARITVTGNRLRNCGNCQNIPAIQITNTNAAPTAFPTDIVCQGNQIDSQGSVAPGFAITAARQVAIQGNAIRGPTNGANNSAGVLIKDSKHVCVQGNTITGFTFGVRFIGTTAEDVSIAGNTMTNIHTNGVNVLTGLLQGISITGNVIDGDSTVTAAFQAIILGDGNTCVGNSIFVAAGGSSVGIQVNGSNNTIVGNQIRGAASQPKAGLVFAGATTGNVAVSNTITSTAVAQITLNGTTINDTTPGSSNFQTA